MIGIKDRGRLPERQVTAAKTRRLQDYERERERGRRCVLWRSPRIVAAKKHGGFRRISVPD
jgi:hypothetical protein